MVRRPFASRRRIGRPAGCLIAGQYHLDGLIGLRLPSVGRDVTYEQVQLAMPGDRPAKRSSGGSPDWNRWAKHGGRFRGGEIPAGHPGGVALQRRIKHYHAHLGRGIERLSCAIARFDNHQQPLISGTVVGKNAAGERGGST